MHWEPILRDAHSADKRANWPPEQTETLPCKLNSSKMNTHTHTHTSTDQSPDHQHDRQFLVCQCKSALQLTFMFQPVWSYSSCGEPLSNHLQAHSHCDCTHIQCSIQTGALKSFQLLTAGYRLWFIWVESQMLDCGCNKSSIFTFWFIVSGLKMRIFGKNVPKILVDTIRCLFFSNLKSKTQRYSIYNDLTQSKSCKLLHT